MSVTNHQLAVIYNHLHNALVCDLTIVNCNISLTANLSLRLFVVSLDNPGTPRLGHNLDEARTENYIQFKQS
jgi:hypothetical protein